MPHAAGLRRDAVTSGDVPAPGGTAIGASPGPPTLRLLPGHGKSAPIAGGGSTSTPHCPKLFRWLIWCGAPVEEAACALQPQRAREFHYFEKPFCVSTETKQTTYHLMLCKSTRGGSSEIHINR